MAGGEIILSKYGEIVADEIKETASMRPNIVIDCFVVMPNHVHMIFRIAGAYFPQSQQTSDDAGARSAPLPSSYQTVGSIVNGIKSAASRRIGFSLFQRGYHDRIIRNNQMHTKISQYIKENPLNWQRDKYYISETPCE